MSFSNCDTTMQVVPAGYNGGNGMWGGDWSAWIILFLIWGASGGGYGGFGGYGGGVNSPALQGALTRGDLCQDMNFQDLQNGVRGLGQTLNDNFRTVDNAICTLGYNQAQLVNGVERQIGNEFRGVDGAICTLGYNTQQGFNSLQAQMASCCCDIKGGIKDSVTQSIMNTGTLQAQIKDCCCENEKIAMQNRFDAQKYNCDTLQAIDKLGDRIIGYLTADKTQTLRDENQALRLAASQVAQNQYLVNQLRPPFPVPAYTVPNPFAPAAAA